MVKFSDLGQKFSGDLMVHIDTEWTTEVILSVRNRYINNILRFFESFVSLDFWSKI